MAAPFEDEDVVRTEGSRHGVQSGDDIVFCGVVIEEKDDVILLPVFPLKETLVEPHECFMAVGVGLGDVI